MEINKKISNAQLVFVSHLEISQELNGPAAKTNTDVEDPSKNQITYKSMKNLRWLF